MKRRVYRLRDRLIVLTRAVQSPQHSSCRALRRRRGQVNNDIGLGYARGAEFSRTATRPPGAGRCSTTPSARARGRSRRARTTAARPRRASPRTRSSIVALIPPAAGDLSSQNGGIKNQATGANGRSENATIRRRRAPLERLQPLGPHFKYEFVTSTGSDEAAQRADAIAVLAEEAVRRHRHSRRLTRRAERRWPDLRRRHRRRQGAGEPDAAHHRARRTTPYEEVTGEFVAKNASTGTRSTPVTR